MPVATYLFLVAAVCWENVIGDRRFPEVTTNSGTVRGTVQKTSFGKEFNTFVGIPYDKPPVGKKSFQGLFQKAILNSGAVSNPRAMAENVREKSLKPTAELGCPTGSSSNILECLRQRPAERIVRATEVLKVLGNRLFHIGIEEAAKLHAELSRLPSGCTNFHTLDRNDSVTSVTSIMCSKLAVPNDPWKGVWNATVIPKECLQVSYFTNELVGAEDCLYLNVYTPKQPSSKPLDVLVYIHGGGFQFLTGAAYGPEYILERDVIYVTLNYRLGVLGFFSLEDEQAPGNNGLKDQNLALKWVNQNIAAFGGDPKKITITGMSAGGASVHYHILSKQSKGLFQRALMNSGAVSNPWATTENVRDKSLMLTAELGCPTDSSSKILECLRQRPAESVVRATDILRVFGYFPLATIGPMIEKPSASAFIDKLPYDIIRDGEANDVPILWSYNSDEGLFPGAALLEDKSGYLDKEWDRVMPYILELNHTVSPKQQAQIAHQIREHYLGGKGIRENPGKLTELLGDRFFYIGIDEAAKLHAEFSTSPVWMYKFSHVGSKRLSDLSGIDDLYKGGACHGDDTHYVLRAVYCPVEGTPKDEAMIKSLTDVWMNFIQGNMPSSWKTVKSGLPDVTLLDIVCSDPKNNVVKTHGRTPGQELWRSFRIPENTIDLIETGHNHNEL